MRNEELMGLIEQEEEEEAEDENQTNNKAQDKKKFLPQEYHKARKNVNKLVTDYFNKLKDELIIGGKLFLNRSRFDEIALAINHYVGLRYGEKRQRLQLRLKITDDRKKQLRNGLFSYLSESEKIINCNQQGKINIITLQKGTFRLPDIATPVPFQNSIFFLDPSSYDQKRKVFVPSPPAVCIQSDGKVKEIASPFHFRSKCAITRDKDYIYLIGGYAGEQKILTNNCQKYNPESNTFEELPRMVHKHHCPSACIISQQIWVFSANFMQFLEKDEWKSVELGWNMNFLPFQYVLPVNQSEIIILGGMSSNQKSNEVKVLNIKEKQMVTYGPLLPQSICSQRSWGPCVIHGCIAILSSVQASIYPQVGVKSSMNQVIYLHENSAYLNSIISLN